MNCREAQRIGIEGSSDTLAERVRNHVDRCGDCHAFFVRRRSVRAYLALGRKEQPSMDFENRLLDAVHKSAAGSLRLAKPARTIKPFPEWGLSAWRWVAAAGLIASIGGWVHQWNPNEPMVFSTAMGPIQASAPLFMDYRHLMSAIAIPDPSPPLAVADTSFQDESRRNLPDGLRFIGFQP